MTQAMKFVCDTTLGKLARYMRILGLDTELIPSDKFMNRYKDMPEKPIFFTRRALSNVPYERRIIIHSELIHRQLEEIRDIVMPFVRGDMAMSRCLQCNNPLVDTDKYDIEGLVPEYVFHNHEQFRICRSCNRVYWRGTHGDRMMEWVRSFTGA